MLLHCRVVAELPFCPNGCGVRLGSNNLGSPTVVACCPICECRFKCYLMSGDCTYATEQEFDRILDAMTET